MKRTFTIIITMVCLCISVWANQEVSIYLDSKDNRVKSVPLGFGYITFEYLYDHGNHTQVQVSVENVTQTPPLAILMFRQQMDESILKDNEPKIKFDKMFIGEKGNRVVSGCPEVSNRCTIITPAETDTVFTISVTHTQPKTLEIPFYIAKYKPNALVKKGKNRIPYTIIKGDIFKFNIESEGWTEEDATYVKTKQSVDSLIRSLDGVWFCNNYKHQPSLSEQQKPYQTQKYNIISGITAILNDRKDWMPEDAPYIAYSKLIQQVQALDFSKHTRDCGKHKPNKYNNGTTGSHYTGPSAQQIYHRLDDTYQQLYSGKISKRSAIKIAKTLYAQYQKSKRRTKDSSYDSKITRFYNSIINY